MNISGVGSAAAQVQAVSSPESKRMQLQMMLLKKSLDMQKAETAAVMQQAEGIGQTIDIRV
jgi:hypothetical protein